VPRANHKIAYVVSRFPHVSETFIVRELTAVDRQPGVDLSLFSLFSPVAPIVHPAAIPWLPRVRRAGPAASFGALVWWLGRRPGRLLACLAGVVRGYSRRPSILLRALATLPIAAAHARTMRRLGVEHVHAHYATYPALAAWTCRRLADIPYSFTAHAHDLFIQQCHLRDKVREAAFVVPVSEFNRAFLARYGAGSNTPAHVIHCGIELEAYRYRPRVPASQGPVNALCVASLQEYKGHRVLLEALAGAEPPVDRLTLDVVGDGELRPSLERLVDRLELDGRVRFHGSLPEDEVSALLGRADLFVLASTIARNGQMDGIPVALMEALACGVPVVATRLSGIPELIRDGETGLLAEPGDPASLRNALEQLITDPSGARRRVEAGRRLVENEFYSKRSAEQLTRLFLESCGEQID
jgi:colanic acid/amylovoran biosynthesis glycosyltransferase